MSSITSIPEPTTTEEYNSNIKRVFNTPLDLPHGLSDMCMNERFFHAPYINEKMGMLYENIDTLISYTKLYNSVYPISSYTFTEYDGITPTGLYLSDQYEILFNSKRIDIYQDRSLVQTITNTDYGDFVNIKDVVVYRDALFVLDGTSLLIIDITGGVVDFITWFGGLGLNNTQYNFLNPKRLIYDRGLNQISVYQENGYIKKYSSVYNFISGRSLVNSIDVDIHNGSYYILYDNRFTIIDSNENTINIIHSVDDPIGIRYDYTQEGFLWIWSETGVYKYTMDGLELGRYNTVDTISDLERNGYTNGYITNGGVEFALDYSFSSSMVGSDLNQTHPLSAVEVMCDEMASDAVINDSLDKLYTNLYDFNNSLTSTFNATYSNDSILSSVELEDSPLLELGLDCNSYFGRDESINCHSWNRIIDRVYTVIIKVRNKVFGSEIFIEDNEYDYTDTPNLSSFFNPTVGGQDAEGLEPQLFNPTKTPISVIELCNNPVLSSLDF